MTTPCRSQRGTCASLEQAAQEHPRDARIQAHLALQYAHAGMHDPALTRIQSALAFAPDDPDVLVNVSDAYGVLGEHSPAMKYALLGLQHGGTLADMRRDPDMQAVLKDPEFQAPTVAKSQ